MSDLDRRGFFQVGAAALAGAGFARVGHAPLGQPGFWFPEAAKDRMAWWREARFGMFIHWGLYSVLAGEWEGRTDYAEWIRNNAHIPVGTYDQLVHRFNPVAFDPDAWVGMARDAGMRYVVITSKHHDGFCLFDSPWTDFNVRATPFKRDIMRAMADACRRHGLRICWYHSIMDWHHPDYLPRRDWEVASRPVDGAQFGRYVQYLHRQVEHLLTHYGDIGVLWFDGQWEATWTHPLGLALYERCRALQPRIIVNNRVDGHPVADDPHPAPLGDFRTPEQEVPATGLPGVDWESCITMNRNWGYNRADHDFKSPAQLVGLLVETASKGGNLLLNVGPTGEGRFPDESVDRLRAIGTWTRVNGEAIHGTTASPFSSAPFRATSAPKRLNLFITDWKPGPLKVPGLRTPVRRAYLLADRGRIPVAVGATSAPVTVTLPDQPPNSLCGVVVLEFDGEPVVG